MSAPPGGGSYLAVGEAMVAFRAPAGERLESAGALALHVVGAELNFSVALRRLGVPAAFAGAVGEDPWGERVRRALRAEGVDDTLLAVDGARPTGLLFREGAAEPYLRVHYRRTGSAASAYRGGDALRQAAAVAAGVHVTGISLVVGEGLAESACAALAAAPSGALRTFDLNVRHRLAPAATWRRVLRQGAAHADIVLAGRDELAAIGLAAREAAEVVWAAGGALVVRAGPDATEVWCEGAREAVPAPAWQGPVVDVVGAGDAFAAALVASRLAGEDWPRAVWAAHLAGAWAVGRLGDYEGAPYAGELRALVDGRAVSR